MDAGATDRRLDEGEDEQGTVEGDEIDYLYEETNMAEAPSRDIKISAVRDDEARVIQRNSPLGSIKNEADGKPSMPEADQRRPPYETRHDGRRKHEGPGEDEGLQMCEVRRFHGRDREHLGGARGGFGGGEQDAVL